ncbi:MULTISPECIES: hypothetical protein [Clostridium]|uniref:Peptidase S1 domain-containing protein n=1 Tax=Clostridium botulinum D str. 1873 TaxID=592027 RepID=A0A9N7G399_CLOBO|nr:MULTISPECIES: hypothetical protein [Clostridium]ACT33748.1 conserved hypothetical protein [Clostridium botulinum D str. 1873]MBO3442132.1 hypothetical protein [Clostridium haemolyticum]QPW56703.1 hypothetical protein IRP61_12325 [Clostridium botulinum]
MNYYNKNKIQKSITDICNCEYEYFFNKANVLGVGCGYKVKNGFYTNNLCIKVFVGKKYLKNKLASQDLVPNLYKGILTDVVESGSFTQYSFTNKIRPVIGGYGIGNVHITDKTGTLGCLVTDGEYNYILSCNHILANNNLAPLGTKIIQPSFQYGGDFKTDVIAILSKFIPLEFEGILKKPTNYSDCAIAKVLNKSLVSPKIALIGMPKGTIIPKLNEEVAKVGERTELTTGKIISINTTVKINCAFLGKKALFKNQIITTSMSNPGDSGAVLLDRNDNVIGILISGTDSHDTFSPINYTLKELNVRIVTEHL